MREFVFVSESVTEGHPDKVCDYISDAVLDACLTVDRDARVACECLAKSEKIVLAGEITVATPPDYEMVVRQALADIDPVDSRYRDAIELHVEMTEQSSEIAGGIDSANKLHIGAGDQGIMFGYATDETPELMPLPILLAHRLTRGLADDRKSGRVPWLRPDGKAQVAVRYRDGEPEAVTAILISTQHTPEMSPRQTEITAYVRDDLAPRVLGEWHRPEVTPVVNPTGSFEHGGPEADAGLTGRKIIVDTYGGAARHGGGAFSGKDPSKVDRSGAYFARWAACRIVRQGIARRAEVQVSYIIGLPDPMSLHVETFGTGDAVEAEAFVRELDWRPGAIIDRFDLRRPMYRKTTNYGHFGRAELPWEEVEPTQAR